MTSNTTPNGEVIGTTQYEGFYVWYAFDNNDESLYVMLYSASLTESAFLGYVFENPICIRLVELFDNDGNNLKHISLTYTIQASNDGSNWNDICTGTKSTPELKLMLDNKNKYRYYRYRADSFVSGSWQVTKLQFYGRS